MGRSRQLLFAWLLTCASFTHGIIQETEDGSQPPVPGTLPTVPGRGPPGAPSPGPSIQLPATPTAPAPTTSDSHSLSERLSRLPRFIHGPSLLTTSPPAPPGPLPKEPLLTTAAVTPASAAALGSPPADSKASMAVERSPMPTPDRQKRPTRKKPKGAARSPAPAPAPLPRDAREAPRTTLQVPARRPKSRALARPRAPQGPAPRGPQRPAGWLPLRAQYLVPLMPYGPNNQLVSLKEVLMLGRLLNRTVIIPDIKTHSSERGGSVPFRIGFKEVFDLDHLAMHYSVVTLAQAREAGWSGRVDAIVGFAKDYSKALKSVKDHGISTTGADFIDLGSFKCERSLQATAKATAGYRVALLMVYQNVVRNAGHGLPLWTTGDRCHDEYLEVSKHVVKSPKIVRLATDFIARRLNGTKYVAVQIRPYPDDCVQEFLKPRFNIKNAGKVCSNGHILKVFVEKTKKALDAAGTRTLVLFSPPDVRHKLVSIYEQAGIRPVVYDKKDLRKEFSHVSNTLLGFVEEEIGVRAHTFIGTKESSITGMIIQERFMHGKDKKSAYNWNKDV